MFKLRQDNEIVATAINDRLAVILGKSICIDFLENNKQHIQGLFISIKNNSIMVLTKNGDEFTVETKIIITDANDNLINIQDEDTVTDLSSSILSTSTTVCCDGEDENCCGPMMDVINAVLLWNHIKTSFLLNILSSTVDTKIIKSGLFIAIKNKWLGVKYENRNVMLVRMVESITNDMVGNLLDVNDVLNTT